MNEQPVDLVVGGGVVDRRLRNADELLLAYREDEGIRYLKHVPITPPDRLLPEDLAVTILINSRVGYRAWKSVADRGPSLDLAALPASPLEHTSPEDRDVVADVIAEVAGWPGLAASVATKVLHKKRPALIPILDNQAIFGSYMTSAWPRSRSSQDSVKDRRRIRDALERLAFDLTRTENARAWPALQSREPDRTLIELFDMTWWSHFRRIEPPSGGTLGARLRGIAAFLPVLERSGFEFGAWQGGVDGSESPQMPFYALGPEAHDLVQTARELGWVYDFDWQAWMASEEGRHLLGDGQSVASATPDQLERLLTVIIRSDHLGDGALDAADMSGLLVAILRRAEALASEAG